MRYVVPQACLRHHLPHVQLLSTLQGNSTDRFFFWPLDIKKSRVVDTEVACTPQSQRLTSQHCPLLPARLHKAGLTLLQPQEIPSPKVRLASASLTPIRVSCHTPEGMCHRCSPDKTSGGTRCTATNCPQRTKCPHTSRCGPGDYLNG